MKRLLLLTLIFGLGLFLAWGVASHRFTSRRAAELAQRQAAWDAERTALQTALDEANARDRILPVSPSPVAAPTSDHPGKPSPAEVLTSLRSLKPGPIRNMRQTIHLLEELIAAGPAALPAIRDFLGRNEDIDFLPADAGKRRIADVPNEFIVPPSLRFALLDVVKQIGGAEGEKLLADTLTATGRGVELAWLARALQEMAPDKYRDAALAAARDLLIHATAANSASPLDRNDRDNLYSVLMMYGDSGFVTTAQAQLLRADGKVDGSALKYLNKTLGPQLVPIAAQMYDDPRLVDPAAKEPLARVALNYVGADAQANQFYLKAINDLSLPGEQRKNLIEDLNQDGFSDRKNLGAQDLPLIQNRLSLIEQLAANPADDVNVSAFREAYKDLLKMRDRASQPPKAKP